MVSPSPASESAPALGRAETPISFIQAIAAAYAQRGLHVDEALNKAQIEPKLLKKNNARVTAMQMELISGIAMQELNDEGLGWFSRRLPWGSYGMLAREPLPLPTLWINPDVKDIFKFTMEDFRLDGYESYPSIKAPMAV